MKMSLWLWMIQNSWHSVSAPPNPIIRRAPLRSNTGRTHNRAAMLMITARTAIPAIGA